MRLDPSSPPSQNPLNPDFYVIGDVQGCAEPLARLLAQIPAHADVWFCGDLINRGPDNLGVLRQVHALGSRARVTLGNHDIHLLGVAAGVRTQGRSDTLDDILLSPDCDDWLNWLRQWPLAHHEHDILMVHAGVMPQWTLEQTLRYSDEAHTMLASNNYIEHLKTLFGSSPNYWKNSLRGADRVRAIINAFTRMRTRRHDGFSIQRGTGGRTRWPAAVVSPTQSPNHRPSNYFRPLVGAGIASRKQHDLPRYRLRLGTRTHRLPLPKR